MGIHLFEATSCDSTKMESKNLIILLCLSFVFLCTFGKLQAEDPCMDLVVDKCPDSSLDVIISLNGSLASWLDCQNLCDTVYQEDCKSVMYMDKEQSCTISKH